MAWTEPEFEEPEITKFAKLNLIGDSIEGMFAGTEEAKNNFGRSEVRIRIKTGESNEGEPVIEVLTANRRLLAQVAALRKGVRVRIEYVDDQINEGVGRDGTPMKPTKLYRVQFDDGREQAKPSIPF